MVRRLKADVLTESQSHHSGIETHTQVFLANRARCPNRTIVGLKLEAILENDKVELRPNRTIVGLKPILVERQQKHG